MPLGGWFPGACVSLLVCLAAAWPFGKSKHEVEEPEYTPTGPSVGSPVDYVDWGVRLGIMGKPERAADRLRRAVVAEPRNAAAHYNLGLALEESGRQSEAIDSYVKAVQLDEERFEARVNLAAALICAGRHDEALKHLHVAAEMEPGDWLVAFNTGCAHLDSGDFKQAVVCFRDAIQADPAEPCSYFNLAVALIGSDCPDLAEAELRRFLERSAGSHREQQDFARRFLKIARQDDQHDPGNE